MNNDRSSWIVGYARPVLAALAILSVVSLATPSASAAIDVQFTTLDVGTGTTTGPTDLGTGGSSGAQTPAGQNFTWTVTSTPANVAGVSGSSTLPSSSIALNNTSGTTDTLDITISGTGFTAGTTNQTLFVNFAVSGTGGPTNTATDTTTGKGWIDFTNTLFGTGIALTPNQTIVPTASSPLSATYTSGKQHGDVTH
jgi:hypothetical protein